MPMFGGMTTNTPLLVDPPMPRDSAGWIRLAAAAKKAGMSPDMLARGCQAGDVPVTLRQIGPRLRFVNGAQFDAWIGNPQTLYTPADLARANREHRPGAVVTVEENLFAGEPQ